MRGIGDNELLDTISKSKVGLIASLNEGSCVAVAEMLYCNLPVALFKDAIVGSKKFINLKTGILLTKSNFQKQIEQFIENYTRYTPREWMIKSKQCCFESTKILNECIKANQMETGQRWSKDLCPHFWRPDPKYVFKNDSDNFENEYQKFHKEYGIELRIPGGEL